MTKTFINQAVAEEIQDDIATDNDLGCCGGDLCDGNTSHNEYLTKYILKKLTQLAKQKDEEFLEWIGEDNAYCDNCLFSVYDEACECGVKNNLRAELRNKLKGGIDAEAKKD